ncbi:hypothetical protein ASPZODRAFT_1858093 [Penicilliopsis zonata CBS 506.65]|uniref:1-phosphatidylinositol-3-phosphate 5-kinase n=1 Tax=Penicilliopsis zonata CBS 506.65 TaxID=1073090 RepID=A0A1L9SIF3_9EURO|nr:hypothetical protein ASPZODRAFT_1858093 [Penicilliopsis zonata CBS 506.65]OJJ46927.1 hypothetical protein ASPZODRAFT_1858093 [Penicilliopsis zonata CBS 506.65]
MGSHRSGGAESPSASSIFLPLGRRASRASISTQAERESLNAALDQIHSTAYQSDSLTVFNDFTNPPISTSVTDDKTLSGELQGGLSGLYNRFRTSVGGVKDIVSGSGKASDRTTTEDLAATKSPAAEFFMRSTPDPAPVGADPQTSHQSSVQGSRINSPVSGNFHPGQDALTQSGVGKGSKFSSKTASISSKASVSPSPALKSPTAPLPKNANSSIAVGPTVTELNVNAIKDGALHSRKNSTNVSSHGMLTSDSASVDREESPVPASMSSSGFSQLLTHSPKLTSKTYSHLHDGPNAADVTWPPTSTNQLPNKSGQSTSIDQQMPSEIDNISSSSLRKTKQTDSYLMPQETIASTNQTSFSPVESVASNSATNSVARTSMEDASFREGQAPVTLATSMSMTDHESRSRASSRLSVQSRPKEGLQLRVNQTRLPGFTISRVPSTETAVFSSAVTASNATLDRGTGIDQRSRKVDGVVSQLRSKLLSKDFWMRDENAKDCFHCGEPFSTFRRKHHCRTCGQIFDSKCTLLIPGARFGQPGSIRVCKPCEAMINAHEDDSSDYTDSEQSPIVVNPRVSDLGLSNINNNRPSIDDDDTASVISQSVERVMKTPTMAIPATRRAGEGHNRRSAVLEIPDRPLARPTSSRSLKSSMSGRPHSMGHKRHHSRQQYIRNFKSYHDDRAPFQRRFGEDMGSESRLPAFHKDSIIDPDLAQYLSDDASSGDEQPSLLSAVSESSFSKSGDHEKATLSGLFAAVKKGRSALGDRSSFAMLHAARDGDEGSVSSRAVNLPRTSRRRNLSVASSIHRQSPRASKDNVFNIHDIPTPGYGFPTGVTSSGFKMTRSSSMRGAGAPPVEMNLASLQHVRRLLRQLLKDSSISHAQSWENALMPILLKAADEVDPDVQRGDDMDIRHYIKLKKIPGGRPGDTSYVSGLVFTKNLALKSMPRSVPNPNILIISFPLEYARQQQQFMSLEPVIRQEREFLANLVSRIAALHPSLLLVEKNVSGLALELLEKANIATAYNVKPSVLEAVSRFTQTRIITSMDKLVTTPMQSQCSSFDVKTYVYNGRRKTYMYISGCPKSLGCTIVLRGDGDSVLMKVKKITEFMVYVVYNLRLETCLMRDEFAQIPTAPDSMPKKWTADAEKQSNQASPTSPGDSKAVSPGLLKSSPNEKSSDAPSPDAPVAPVADAIEVPEDAPMPTFYEDIVQRHETIVLSASPCVKFEPPYLLMRAREMERRLAHLKQLRDQGLKSELPAEEETKPQKFILVTPEMVHKSLHNAPPKVKEVLNAAHEAEHDRALDHYQAQKRQWEAYISGNSDLFDPYAHQNIVVLFSLVCTTTSIPCSGPDVFALEYYNEHGGDRMFEPDCTIGQYVEDLCHNANSICTVNGCEKRMFEHHRQYVHGEAQISIFIQPYPSKLRGLQDTILMWSCCKICGNETQVIPMSDNTWKYSFGKYLEISFWSKNLHARAGVCPHDLQRDHLRYFGFKDVALRIHYDAINLLEVIVPGTRVTWKVDNDLKLRNEVYLKTERRLNMFMASVNARLKGINVESVIPELAEDCKKEIDSLVKKASEDQAILIKQLQDKYTNSRYWEVTPLNEAMRSVQEKVVEWDTAFAEFEKNFFPSEKDIKRLATLQLRKIFLDKDASVTSVTSAEEAPTTPTEPGEEKESETSAKPRALRRMTLSPEKAQDVFVSVVEEHSGKKNRDKHDAVIESPELSPSLDEVPKSPALNNHETEQGVSSPQLEAMVQDEVQHLDLALPSNQPIQIPLGLAPSSSEPTLPPPDTTPSGTGEMSTDAPAAHPVENQGPIQNNSKDGSAAGTPPSPQGQLPSAIPRLAEGAFRRTSKTRPSPIFRTQSQPSPPYKDRSLNGSTLGALKAGFGNLNGNDGALSPPFEGKLKFHDRKLSDRLGLSALKSGRLPSGHSLIPRSIPKKNATRVSSLAKHFEQLSREFEKERQRERQQRAARGIHSRAYPMASSKPVVEVYRNVREAVEEREPSGEGEDLLSLVPRVSLEETNKNNEEPVKQVAEEQKEEIVPDLPVEPDDNKEIDQADNQNASEAEAEADEEHSDEDKAFTDELHLTESHEELGKMSPEDESMDIKDLPKHERNTLLQLLTNFWSERSASGWDPLEYPLKMSEHMFTDCDIIVREDEPSSLIAFALDSPHYKEKLASFQAQYEEQEEPRSDSSGSTDSASESRLEHALLRATGTHLKYQFQEGQAKMLCKIFYAEQFDALRTKCGVAERIVESLSRCAKWDSKGGKTKSLFLKTLDDRFILKSLSTIETQAFLKFAPAYFQIMSEALFHELPSAIAKMFGFYQVIIKNPATGTEFNWFLLLMENLFYDRVPTRIFDLKGSMRNRKVQSTGERNEVLLDENMVDFIYETPLFAREHSKKLLGQSVWNDTLFLGRQNVMDYSLMIAIDENRRELVVGIIDCIRTYTWDKKLESWIKDRGFAGGGKNRPTVTSPKEYKSRFREAMARYVLQAPSCWHQFQPSHMYRYPRIESQLDQIPNTTDVDSVDGSADLNAAF